MPASLAPSSLARARNAENAERRIRVPLRNAERGMRNAESGNVNAELGNVNAGLGNAPKGMSTRRPA